MSNIIETNKDETLFKSVDNRYINYRGTDITGIVSNTLSLKPQKFFPVSSQPQFYLVTFEYDEALEQSIDTAIQGPYSTKEEAKDKEMKNQYVLLATSEKVEELMSTFS